MPRATSTTSRSRPARCGPCSYGRCHAHAELRRVDTAAAQGAPGVVAVCIAADLDLPLAPVRWVATARWTGRGSRPAGCGSSASRSRSSSRRHARRRTTRPSSSSSTPTHCHPSSTRSPRSNRRRRCSFPSSVRIRRPARCRPPVVTVGPTPRSWCAPACATAASRPRRWSRTVPSRYPRAIDSRCTQARSRSSVYGVRSPGALGVDEARSRCAAPAVGGGFGAKGGVYNEQVVVAALARASAGPSRGPRRAPRTCVNMTHARGQVHDVEIGAKRDGTIVGLRVRTVADVGAYPIRGAFIPDGHALHGFRLLPNPRDRGPRGDRRHQHDADRSVPRRGTTRSCGNVRAVRERARGACSGSTRSKCGAATSLLPTRSRTERRPARRTTPATTTRRSTKPSA